MTVLGIETIKAEIINFLNDALDAPIIIKPNGPIIGEILIKTTVLNMWLCKIFST